MTRIQGKPVVHQATEPVKPANAGGAAAALRQTHAAPASDTVTRTVPANARPAVKSGMFKATDKPLPASPGNTSTEFYSMSGELLGVASSQGRKAHIMVDEAAYTKFMADTFPDADLEVPETANQFVDGLVDALTTAEKASKTDLIASETGESLTFTGEAQDKVWPTQVRQMGVGTLHVMAAFDNGKSAECDAFSVVSGAMQNGLLPNGTYTAQAPVNAIGMFPDETGKYGMKMVLTPKDTMTRGDFRIHSVVGGRMNHGSMTEGCVGLNGGHDQNVRFFDEMQAYFQSRKAITLTVDVTGNANVKTQLGSQYHY